MSLVPAICTQCGSPILVDETKEAGICKYCDTAFITEKAIYNYNYIHNTTNITNTKNIYNMKDSQVHIHNSYDDPETLLKNINGLLERGYGKDSEQITNNFKVLEEKYPLDAHTDKAKWLCRADEAALLRLREVDKVFFYQHASSIKDGEKIISFLQFDEELFKKCAQNIKDRNVIIKYQDAHPVMQKLYNDLIHKEQQEKIDRGNHFAKLALGIQFTGEFSEFKEAFYNVVHYLKNSYKPSIDSYKEFCRLSLIAHGELQAADKKEKDEKFLMAVLDWYIDLFSTMDAHGFMPEIAIEASSRLPVSVRKSMFNTTNSDELKRRTHLLKEWKDLCNVVHSNNSNKWETAYNYCNKPYMSQNYLKYTFLKNIWGNFKKGLLKIKYKGLESDFTVDAFVNNIGKN